MDKAAAVVSAAAGLATTVIAAAAVDATKALASAASEATKAVATSAASAAAVVQESTAKALAEFPDIKEDIRELRTSQGNVISTLTSVVTELMSAREAADIARFEPMAKSVEEIKGHMEKQNGRLAKAEKHIIRQNLVLFGIAGPVCLALGGYLVHAIILAGGLLKLFAGIHP